MEEQAWIGPTMERLAGLMTYPDKANEFNCKKVTADAERVAKGLLLKYMRPMSPVPRIVPSPEGGLRFEWHEYWVDLSLDVHPNGAQATLLLKQGSLPMDYYTASPEVNFLLEHGLAMLEDLRVNGPPPLPERAPAAAGEAAEPLPRPSRKLNPD